MTPNPGWSRPLGVVLVVAVVGWGLWYWFTANDRRAERYIETLNSIPLPPQFADRSPTGAAVGDYGSLGSSRLIGSRLAWSTLDQENACAAAEAFYANLGATMEDPREGNPRLPDNSERSGCIWYVWLPDGTFFFLDIGRVNPDLIPEFYPEDALSRAGLEVGG
jgi:hypothetical protein